MCVVAVGIPGFINDVFIDAVTHFSKVIAAAHALFADEPERSPLDRTNQAQFGSDTIPAAPPPPPPPGGEGGLNEGAQDANDQYTGSIDAATVTDEKLAGLIEQIFASSQQARDKVSAILQEIRTKQQQVGPELGDPAALTAFQQFVDRKFAEIQKILADAQVDAESQAAILEALGDEYRGGASNGPGATGGPSDDAPGGVDAADPAGSGVAPAGQEALVDPLAGLGALGPIGGVDPLSAMAGLGAVPAALGGKLGAGGLPLDGLGPALGSLGGLAGLADPFNDVPPPERTGDDDFVDEPSDTDDSGSDDRPTVPDEHGATQADTTEDGGHDSATASAPADAAPASTAPLPASAAPALSVSMPDGSVVTAPSESVASAMRSVLSGTNVTDAYQAVDVTLAPPGTPVTDPVDPAHLEPGAVARFESREPVMAMGNGKIWLDGQLQPLSALGSASDFLGWSKPPAPAAAAT